MFNSIILGVTKNSEIEDVYYLVRETYISITKIPIRCFKYSDGG